MKIQQPRRSSMSATAEQLQRSHCTALLTHDKACSSLHALTVENTHKVPATSQDRLPARDTGTSFADRQPRYDRAEPNRLFTLAESKRRKAEAHTLALQDQIARQAQDQYRAGVIEGIHRYITIKQLSGLHNARIDATTGALLIPMWVSDVGWVNLQQIFADGTKRFLKGGKVKGAYSVIGSLNGAAQVLVCEGWATGATLAERYGLPVVVAFNAGNLMPMCQALRSRLDNLAVVVAGDDDRQNTVNTGHQKAVQAAEAVGANLLFPELCKCCRCTDHNDVAVCRRRCARG